jgi:uncharacterized membrane protein HdeD (DUF308 family)
MSAPSASVTDAVRKSLRWSVILSVFLILAGTVSIILPAAASLAATVFFGAILLFSGAVHLVYGWQTRRAAGMIWQLLIGIVYIVAGAYMLWNPVLGTVSLTLALAAYLFAEALLEFILSISLRPGRGWAWVLFDAVVTLVLAVLIWKAWPQGSFWVLGTLVGISILFSGVARLMFALSARKLVPATA